MKSTEIVEALKNKKGQHVQATWQRTLKTRKKLADGMAKVGAITKRTCAWVRAGIDYANLATVKQGMESGERGQVQPLPAWQEWQEWPFILRNKTNGTEYVRLYPATFENLRKETKVEWKMDGVVCTYDEVKPYLLAEDRQDAGDRQPSTFAVKSADVLEIAGE